MPNYTYRCDACEHVWEAFYTMAEYKKPCEEPCPECNEMKVQKAVDNIQGVQIDTNADWTNTKNLPNSLKERMNQIAEGLPTSNGARQRMKDQYN